ncbi:MAG: rhomboid family intramembrane serine protease [Candidatus Hodarchaeales archaeon]|jgi:membrane associated rhomboid family serine protease
MIVKRLFTERELPIPFGTVIFAISCIIVTLPLLFFPLHKEFTPNPSRNQFFQFIINLFGHGSENFDTLFHLLPNLVGIILLGTILERSIGTIRFGILLVSSWFTVTLFQLFVNIYGLGSSGIFYSWFPFILVILYYDYKQDSSVVKNPFFLLILVASLYSVFITPFYWAQFGGLFYFTNSVHYVAMITGVIILYFWKKQFFQNLDKINGYFSSNHDREFIIDETAHIVPLKYAKYGFLFLFMINLTITSVIFIFAI